MYILSIVSKYEPAPVDVNKTFKKNALSNLLHIYRLLHSGEGTSV